MCAASYPYVVLGKSMFDTGDSVRLYTYKRDRQFRELESVVMFPADDYMYNIRFTDMFDYKIELPARGKTYTVHSPEVSLDTMRTNCMTNLFAAERCVSMPQYLLVNGDTTKLDFVQYQCQLRIQ